jgi:hypothetical protein
MSRSAEETRRWVAGNISKMSEVREAVAIGPNTLRIVRRKYSPFIAGVISVAVVTAESLQALLDPDLQIEIIVNVPKESPWTESASLQ